MLENSRQQQLEATGTPYRVKKQSNQWMLTCCSSASFLHIVLYPSQGMVPLTVYESSHLNWYNQDNLHPKHGQMPISHIILVCKLIVNKKQLQNLRYIIDYENDFNTFNVCSLPIYLIFVSFPCVFFFWPEESQNWISVKIYRRLLKKLGCQDSWDFALDTWAL